MTPRRTVLPILVLAALAGPASAAQVTLTDQWQNLGPGPLLISVLNGDGMFEASATAPTDSGQPIFRNQQPFAFNTTSSIWAKRRSTSYNTVATFSSVSIGGSLGGTGGVRGATVGTTPATLIAANPARRSLLVYNQSASASVTLCNASAGVTAASNAAGCFTLNPNGGQLTYPPSGYVPQDAFTAVAGAANTPVTIEEH